MIAGKAVPPIERVLGRLSGVRKNGSGFTALCLAHDDSQASLSIAVGDDGRVLLKCFAGCTIEKVVEAIGLKMADLFPPTSTNNRKPKASTRETIWPAFNAETGAYIAEHVRLDGADGKKMFWRRPDGKLGLPEGVGTADLALYGAGDLDDTTAVIVAEGQKAADALVSQGIMAVGTVTGAAGCPGDAALRPIVGKAVKLWPDNDNSGDAHMTKLATALRRLGCRDIRRITWHDAPDKGDAADAVALGVDVTAMVATAGPWKFSNIDLAGLLDNVARVLRKYVLMTAEQSEAGALWVAHTHAFEAADATPYLAITSAEKQSGKTRLLEALDLLAFGEDHTDA
jgi:hypothetical protein